MLSNGLAIPGFSEWNFINICGSIDIGVRLLVILFNKIDVQWVEFSLMSWLHCVGVQASVIRIA
jgi:hypothetical protein